MAATAKRESHPDFFVGQVLARSSPILTWRPALARRVAEEAMVQEISADSVVDDRESSVHRISRAPTRRMVAWPVIPQVRRAHRMSAQAIAWRVAVGALVVMVLVAVGVAVQAWEARGIAHASPPVARVVAAHVLDEGFDTLVPPATPALAPVVAAAAPQAAPAPAAKVAAPPAAMQRGRAHHGHRRATSTR